MPTYVYECKYCGHKFEKSLLIAKRNDPLLEDCVKCGRKTIIKSFEGDTLAIGDPVKLGIHKPPLVFRERLKQIYKNFPKPRGIFNRR